MFLLNKLFKSHSQKVVESCAPLVKIINEKEEVFSKLSDEELKAKTVEFRKRLSDGETLDDLLPEAFSAVREASKRTLKQRHFDVQLIGGIVLHKGMISEMKTGEGKTLVATLPAYLNALAGKGVHVVTVNDYLSRRDAVWMGQIYSALGLSTGIINHDSSYLYDPNHKELDEARDNVASFKVVYEFLRPTTRKEAYLADITYGTNSEFGFDYLRDNISHDINQVRQRSFNYAIVDEIDSILIDEARTPLIISAPSGDSGELYIKFAQIAEKLNKEEDFTVDEKFKQIQLTDSGINKAEKILGVENIYTEKGIKYVHHLETAVRAKALFAKDKEYVVRDNEIIIVDEFTGRMQPGRRWSEGLHQAVEAKEGVKIQQESRTYASVTYQNFFRMYEKLSGMTGTATTSAEEFLKVYKLDTVEVPTNKKIARKDLNDLIFRTEQGKFKALSRKIKEVNKTGQPILVGTVSIEKNEILSAYLSKEGVKHEMLNAKNHEREGEIIALAGKKGSVTIATNMAGRGVDIKLGGPEATEAEREEIRKLGGLFVMGTERHEARRIDNQLRGRSGRQGDPGETQFYVSLEDSLMRVFAPDYVKKLMQTLGIAEDEPIETPMISKALESAQTKIEGFHFDARKHVLSYDDVMNYQRKIIYGRRMMVLSANGESLKKWVEESLFANADEAFKKIIEEKKKQFGESVFYQTVKSIYLQTNDILWMDQLDAMDYLRSSVNLRAYGQRDPLVEYKKEGLRMYKQMEESIISEMYRLVPHIASVSVEQGDKQLKDIHANAVEISSDAGENKAKSVKSGDMVDKGGRNDKVIVVKDGSEKEIKNKKLEQYLKDGWVVKR